MVPERQREIASTHVCSSRRYASAKRPRQSGGKFWLTFRSERTITRAVGASSIVPFSPTADLRSGNRCRNGLNVIGSHYPSANYSYSSGHRIFLCFKVSRACRLLTHLSTRESGPHHAKFRPNNHAK